MGIVCNVKQVRKHRLLSYREVATAFGSLGEECLPRNEITDMMSVLLGLSRHSCLLYWKGSRPIGVNLYARLLCWYGCLRFATTVLPRIRAFNGAQFDELSEWEFDDAGRIIGISCVIDGTVHYTLLFSRFERELSKLGYDIKAYGQIGAV